MDSFNSIQFKEKLLPDATADLLWAGVAKVMKPY
jgi:hypothetical protein